MNKSPVFLFLYVHILISIPFPVMAIANSISSEQIAQLTKEDILHDYRIAHESRQASIIGRREVLTGKAKFGIFGDGKELAQLALARVFKAGDWRSGYYRDQTFMLAAEMTTLEEFFSQLYGDTDTNFNPSNGGRMMNNHYSTRILDQNGNWKSLRDIKITAADLSPTAGQMPRAIGLGLASKIYRNHPNSEVRKDFSHNGNEVVFANIGDSSTSEGLFLEAFNAAGVLQIPLAISVWDDGYGISVPLKYQTTKQSISEALLGFKREEEKPGFEIYVVRGWDYPTLIETYKKGVALCRKEHIPVLFHITELTQPQGHSTSGSHERYKNAERLQWEKDHDCIVKMRQWILESGIASEIELDKIEKQAQDRVRQAKKTAWDNYQKPILALRKEFIDMVNLTNCHCSKMERIDQLLHELKKVGDPIRKDVISTSKKILRMICHSCSSEKSLKQQVGKWLSNALKESNVRYSSFTHSQSEQSALNVPEIKPIFSNNSKKVNGREVLLANFDHLLEKYKEVIIFGEDVGKIGGVNQTLEGLQLKYGEVRISDTGIREATIIGQGIGLAMRGLRPIAEIQYFDYLIYALQVLSDDLATLHYRSAGGQKAPLIISTRGHRLEGIWHSGSPLSMLINSVRGIYVLVPRNMTQAAGFYNTMLQCDDPAIVIEPLNGYRLKEILPDNIGEYTVVPGKPEILRQGNDVTLVTYGACIRIAEDAADQLSEYGISVDLIDVQSLLPFDTESTIVESLKKTNKIVFFDEDVPGGATSFMMQKVLEEQNGYQYLDAKPITITAREHRAAYSSDGDYFSNPNAEDVFDAIYTIMHHHKPQQFPPLYPS
jgi:2-oxoisovalerate dehydrogenase E1 component